MCAFLHAASQCDHACRYATSNRLWDYVPSNHQGTPQWYVVHAWSGSFSDLVTTLVRDLAPTPPEAADKPAQPASPDRRAHAGYPRPLHSSVSALDEHMQHMYGPSGLNPSDPKASIFVWLDLFAVNHAFGRRATSEAAHIVEQAQTCCSKGCILALDRHLHALNRMWCLFEVAVALRRMGQTKFRIALPMGLPVSIVENLNARFGNIDITRTDTSNPKDKAEVLANVSGC